MPGKRPRLPSLRSIEERNQMCIENQGLIGVALRDLHPTEIEQLGGRAEAWAWGQLALMRAAELWCEGRALAFSTYAVKAIKHFIRDKIPEVQLYHVPRWKWQELRRARARIPCAALGLDQDHALRPVAGDDGAIGRDEDNEELEYALRQLSEEDAEMIRSRHLRCEPLGEMADRYGLHRQTMAFRIQRAFGRLREILLARAA